MSDPKTMAGRALVATLATRGLFGREPVAGQWLIDAIIEIEREAAAIPPDAVLVTEDALSETIWNVVSVLGHAEHGFGECDVCDTHRALVHEVVSDDAHRVFAALRKGQTD